jgi:sigma-B regulation protein RsbU (phosphoserine phosphatase)
MRAIRERYGKLRRELVDARKIHEEMFPEPIESGPLRMRLAYRPAQHIGGDYVFALPASAGPADQAGGLHLLVLDVTGHGVRAALTVNRIHGELSRLLAINPHLGPAELLAGLNEYLHLTVANHSLFATALAMYADLERGVLRWASAGHPPAILRSLDNRIFRLAPTGIVLGAVPPEQFHADVEEIDFAEGDTVIAYTDGAIEAVDRSGKMVRVQGFEQMVASAPAPRERPHEADLASHLAGRLDEVRAGRAEDDTLIVQLSRAMLVEPKTPLAEAAPASSAAPVANA